MVVAAVLLVAAAVAAAVFQTQSGLTGLLRRKSAVAGILPLNRSGAAICS